MSDNDNDFDHYFNATRRLQAEVQRLTAELALKDQALNEIKALAQELRFVYSQVIEDEYERGHRHEEDDIKRKLQRVLTRLDTQGETK